MKWVALALILLAMPLLTAWLRTNPRFAPVVWAMLGFLPFVLGPWHLMVAPYASAMWSGYVKGWEISLLDSIALAVIFGTRGRWPRLTLIVPLLAYVAAVAISISQAKFGTLASSYLLQLLRIVVVFVAVAKLVQDDRGERAVLTGLIAGLAVQAGYALWARMGGALQTGGSMGHQNLLGFVSHMAIMPAFALLLAGRWQRVALVGVIAGVIAVILTASRATIAFSAIGLILTLLLSMAIRMTPRKAAIGLAGIVFLGASVPLANAALQRRFDAQGSSFFTEDQERVAFERAAHLMLTERPMGVGPNHYVFVANTEGYSARAGVSWSTGSRATNVHNSYMLVAAETGWLGIVTLVTLLASAIWFALATAVRYRRQPGSEILIGVACALIAVGIHALYEWMFVTYPAQYLFAVSLGLIAGLRSRFARAVLRSAARAPARLPDPVPPRSYATGVPSG